MSDALWVDLHTHTSASDGDLSPAELVDAAKGLGLGAVAVTDHDTVEGISEAMTRGMAIGFEVIPGVEISVEVGKGGTFHLLGFYVEVNNPELRSTLHRLQRARSERNDRILECLTELGMPLDREVLARCAGDGQMGRPHMAQAMVQQGYVASVEEAFSRYLRKGAPAYVDKFRMGPKAAISMIRRAKGVPVLAHPYTLKCPTELELEFLVARLEEEAGLMGIEVLYPDHAPQQAAHYRYLANKYGLVMTGGTDFHGKTKPDVLLGWGRGDLRVPYAWAEALRQRVGEIRGSTGRFVLDKTRRRG